MNASEFLRYLVENEYFIACPPVRAQDFMAQCRDRGLRVTRQYLERLEQLGFLHPIARAEQYKYSRKLALDPSTGEIVDLGPIADGENWQGDTTDATDTFRFPRRDAQAWLAGGLLWAPQDRPFVPWESLRGSTGLGDVESFYSIFQVVVVRELLRITTSRVDLTQWGSSPEAQESIVRGLTLEADVMAGGAAQLAAEAEEVARLCQVISNRYYWSTRTDRRRVWQSVDSRYMDWDWNAYRRDWSAERVAQELGLSNEEVIGYLNGLRGIGDSLDPLANWYSLLRFVSVEKRDWLKGDALMARRVWEMEEMVRQFYNDWTGADMPRPHERPSIVEERHGEGVMRNQMRLFEYLVNSFNLNPRPSVIVGVEGDGEYEQLPRIAEEFFGYPFENLGIDIVNLRGISGITGNKADSRSGGAMRRFIDDNHHRGTVVFLIFDNEQGTSKVRRNLIDRRSDYDPVRCVTRGEYVCMWRRSVEFDNFTPKEIAAGLTRVAEGRYAFSATEVQAVRIHAGKRDVLSELYRDRLAYDLDKPRLLETLVGTAIARGEREIGRDGAPRRKIFRVVDRIVRTAMRNHFPTRADIHGVNQNSGFFGKKWRPSKKSRH